MPEDQPHRAIARFEQRAPGRGAQAGHQFRLRGANAAIHLMHAEAEVEQQRVAILRTQRSAVRPNLGQRRALAHRARGLREAERDPLAPRTGGDGLECHRPQVGARLDAQPAARRHDRERLLGMVNLGRLGRVTHEFRDGAERAETPLRIRVGDLRLNQLELTRHSFPFRSTRAAMIVQVQEFGYSVPSHPAV